MSEEELRRYDERIESLAKGIGRHLETLQGQIWEQFDHIEHKTSEHFIKIDTILEGYMRKKYD